MNRIVISIILLLAALTIATVPVYSQNDGSGDRVYGFLMLEEPVNPRNISMGSAGTALGGPGFRYYNPAAPFFSASSYVSAEFGQMPGGVNKGGFESALAYPGWFTAVSFYSNAVGFETRDERGFGAAATSGTTFGAFGAGFVRGNLSLAASLNVAEDRIWVSSSYTAVALSAGLGYKTVGGKLNLGAALFHHAAWSRGFGEDASRWGDGRVPTFARAGAAWSDTLGPFPYAVAADAVYSGETGTFAAPVGIDVKVLPYVSLRLGKRIGWESEIMSLGIGFNIDRISFDAAFVPAVFVDDYEMKWGMSFTYSLGARRRKEIEMPPVMIKPDADEEHEAEEEEEESSPETTEPPEEIDAEDETDKAEKADEIDDADAEPSEPAEPPESESSAESTTQPVEVNTVDDANNAGGAEQSEPTAPKEASEESNAQEREGAESSTERKD